MTTLQFKAPDGVYSMVYDSQVNGHFAIDCACGGKSGSCLKGTKKELEQTVETYKRSHETILQANPQYEHTFYMNDFLFAEMLYDHSDLDGKAPLLLICRDCSREFLFSLESYLDLLEKMK